MTGKTSQGALLFEPSLSSTFLPGCAACHAPHPLARRPPLPPESCPDCGAPQFTGATVDIPAEITGRGLWPTLARICFRASRFLARLIERL